MTNTETLQSANFTELAAEIVSAYVASNPVPTASLAELIATVHSAVAGLSHPSSPVEQAPTPAVNPKRSIHADYIVCLEDGKRFKSLKRHLMTHYDLTPEAYREKWGLPRDYPMVAPSYAAARSALAKSMGLGRKPKAKAKTKQVAKSRPGSRR